jgi:non-ribosomal peptide synthetase component F
MSPLHPRETNHSLTDEITARRTAADFSSGVIPSTFERQTEKFPDEIAVVHGSETLTYRELNIRSNQIAHYLRKAGVSAETMVGIFMDRSLNAIAAIVGILKAGGAYVPIDPVYPQDRVEFILEDANVGIVLTQRTLAPHLSAAKRRVLAVDDEREMISRESRDNPSPVVTPENAAYVIYTSGSTGKPKGVVVTHRNVVRLFKGCVEPVSLIYVRPVRLGNVGRVFLWRQAGRCSLPDVEIAPILL